jgi:hypothetical protein
MLESKLTHLADPLREMLCNVELFLGAFRERTGARLAGVTCDMFPPEVTASLGLLTTRMPSPASGCCTAAGASDAPGNVYDCLVVPHGCTGRGGLPDHGLPVIEFPCPAGWGGESSAALAAALDGLLESAGCGGLASIDAAALRAATQEYNVLRRLARGIASARSGKPELFSCRDLAVVHEAAMVFPPPVVSGHLAALLEALNGTAGGGGSRVPALTYASFTGADPVFDAMEEAGCLIVEDDACGGRRQFDMSYNHESPELLTEILDAFSFRPRCPAVRPVEERVDLFYSMMKSQGIELVIFVRDLCCPARARDIERLRVKLMRLGVDPLVVNSADAAERVGDYIARM